MGKPDLTITVEMPPTEGDASLRNATRELYRELREAVDADVRLASGGPVAGEKAEPVTLGLIILTAISSGTAARIIESLRKAVGRDSSLTVKVSNPDGKTVEVSASNISLRATEEAVERLVTDIQA